MKNKKIIWGGLAALLICYLMFGLALTILISLLIAFGYSRQNSKIDIDKLVSGIQDQIKNNKITYSQDRVIKSYSIAFISYLFLSPTFHFFTQPYYAPSGYSEFSPEFSVGFTWILIHVSIIAAIIYYSFCLYENYKIEKALAEERAAAEKKLEEFIKKNPKKAERVSKERANNNNPKEILSKIVQEDRVVMKKKVAAKQVREEKNKKETLKTELDELMNQSKGRIHTALTKFIQKLEKTSEIMEFVARDRFSRSTDSTHTGTVIVIWSRGLSTFTEKDKLALILSELFWLAGGYLDEHHDDITAGIIYNNGDCRINVESSFLHSSFMKHLERHSLILPPNEAFSQVFSQYQESFSSGVPIIENLMKKGATWLNADDLSTSRIFSHSYKPFSLLLGGLKDSEELVLFDRDESLITIAPLGSGKTLCHVLPNLTTYCGPVIALDVKGDCYEATHDVREKLGAVHRFSPMDIENSAHYNPLDFVTDDPLKVWEDAQKLTQLIIVTEKADHWDKRAAELLTAIISHVKLNCDEKNMTAVCDWTYASVDEFNELISELATSTVNGMRRTGKAMMSTLKNSPKMFESNLESLRGYLGAWQGDNITAITNKSDWSPSDFMTGKNSPSLFLVIPPTEIATYATVLRVLIGQHLECFFRDHTKPAPWPILVMLDEMPQLGQMDLINKAQDTGRSYNVKLWMFAQYVGQMQKAYGKEIAEGMIAAAGVRLYMNPSDDNAANISAILGETDNIISGVKEPLASATELMGRDYDDDVIGRGKGEAPIRLSKMFYGSMNREVLVGKTLKWAAKNVTLEDEALGAETAERSFSDAVKSKAEVSAE